MATTYHKLKNYLCCLCALAFSVEAHAAPRKAIANLDAATAHERSLAVSDVSYDLDINLGGDKATSFSSRASLRFSHNGNGSDLTVDLSDATISALFFNGEALDKKNAYNGFFITLPGSRIVKGNNVLLVEYTHDYSRAGVGLHRFVDSQDGAVYIYSNLEPYYANKVFPSFDQPNLKAHFKLRVTAPSAWTVVSALRESSNKIAEQNRIWEFPQTDLISTYIFPIHAGPFQIWESKAGKTPLRLFARKTLAKYVDPGFWFKTTTNGMKFFEDYFSYPYPFKKYDQLIVPEFNWGGMENVGAVTYTENYIKRGKSSDDDLIRMADTILHELSHMWFGNLVTMNWWDDLWLNESFATYMANIALIKTTKFKSAWREFHTSTKVWGYDTDALKTRHPIATVAENTDVAFSNLDGITYAKGASVVKQLVQVVSEQKFRAGLRSYFKNHQYANTKLSDFLQAISAAAKSDLSSFSEEWLQTTGTNTASAEVSCKDGVLTSLLVRQSSTAPDKTLRTHHANIALYDIKPGGRLAEKVLANVAYKDAQTAIKVPAKSACPVIVNLNKDDTDFVNQSFDEKMTSQILTSLSSIPDPLDRMVLVTELWKKVELGELSFKRFSNFALNLLSEEKDPDLNKLIFRYMMRPGNPQPAFAYLPSDSDDDRKVLTNHIKAWEDLSWQKITTAQSLNTRSAAVKLLLIIATTDSGLKHLIALLNAKPKSELSELMNQENRWKAILRLVATNHSEANNFLKNEAEADKSSTTAQWLLAAQAAKPDLKAKRALFDKINNAKSKFSLQDKKSVVKNLFPFGQQDLQIKFADDYYNFLPKMSGGADADYLGLLTTSLVPTFCSIASESRLRKFLEQNAKLPYVAKRNLEDVHEKDEACIKARSLVEHETDHNQ